MQFKERLVDAYAKPKDPTEQVKKINIYNLKQGANETVGNQRCPGNIPKSLARQIG